VKFIYKLYDMYGRENCLRYIKTNQKNLDLD